MKSKLSNLFTNTNIGIIILLITISSKAFAGNPPFAVSANLFDHIKTDDLGLEMAANTETISIFQPTASSNHFSNGAVLIGFKGWLYCQWQSSAQDEDASDTWVAYSRSQDGVNWEQPMVLATSIENGYCSSGGWWVNADTLIAYINVWPSDVSPRGGFARYTSSTDGLNWTNLKPLQMANGAEMNAIFEQDPHALPNGRIINAAHFQPGLIVSPIYTDDPSGIRGWKKATFTNLSVSSNVSRELEPSWFLQQNGTVVMTFRDQNGTFLRLASASTDGGNTWSNAELTNMPDSRSKQCAGNLPDGTAYLIGNPVNSKTRIPLAITLSSDGQLFNKAFVLRKGGNDLQTQQYTGKSKTLGYSYPKSTIWENYLYVSYTTNKEDVQLTRVLISDISINSTASSQYTTAGAETESIRIETDNNGLLTIWNDDYKKGGIASLYNLQGKWLFDITLSKIVSTTDLNALPNGMYILQLKTTQARSIKLIKQSN